MTYRPKFHLTPPQGRLNDPNGLTLIGDELHVFYQHDPSFPRTPKRTGWGHAVTRLDDGRFYHLPDALYPDFPYDANGCYSGSAVVHEGHMRLFYTGNLKVDGERVTSQNIVDVEDVQGPLGGVYHRRADNPAIEGFPEGFTPDFRDPHVTQAPDGSWRMVIGARRENNTGAVVVYTSQDLDTWELAGPLEFVGLDYNTASAYMWECPNLLRMEDRATGEVLDVLVFCPQFPDSDECGYVVGRLDGLTFEVVTGFTPLDYGHEFYAPQLVSLGAGALMLGWMGLPARDDTPTFAAEGWVHQLTLPRELSLIDATLHTTLRLPRDQDEMLVSRQALDATPQTLELVDVEGNVGATVAWAPQTDGDGGQATVRGTLSVTVDGLMRWAECGAGELVCTADGSALELTAGGGEVAFSSAVFAPNGNEWASFQLA
ncbi:glycoside hydrolase family 32 protein [Corynebacterium hadale]|uniref:glycoside hydrolase family 32 protein n=1 Tax=Corynebacterium hadale TaxID=2026255 RepID=UPI000BAA47D7|nr:glycoside hydrolase family 32 protein [Corynebacterium hadale]PAT13106.1 beta-fructosidase [Corynebacterium hadale]